MEEVLQEVAMLQKTHAMSLRLHGLISHFFSSGHCCSQERRPSTQVREEREAQVLPVQAIMCE